MPADLFQKFRKVPAWTVRKSAKRVARTSIIADAAIPTFSSLPRTFLDSHGYCSQIGQDYLIDQILLGSLETGFYVDVGAHDGITLSNTFFFESVRGWRGLCIEPNPNVHNQLVLNRNCITEQVAVGSHQGAVDFLVINGPDMLSGVQSSFNRRHRRRIRREIQAANGSQLVTRVPLRTLQSVLEKHQITEIDLLSIDTEGSELQVLKGLNFKKTRVSCIIVERNFGSGRIPEFLRKRGFIRIMSLAWDDIYIRDDLRLGRKR